MKPYLLCGPCQSTLDMDMQETYSLIFIASLRKIEDWRLKIEDWRLKIEDWGLKIEDWRLKIEDW